MSDEVVWIDQKNGFGHLKPEVLMTTSGLDLCKRMIAGELPPPPMSKLMNFRMYHAEEGRVVFRGEPLLEHYNPAGVVHGRAATGQDRYPVGTGRSATTRTR